MEDELQAARERRLQRGIDQMVTDFRRGFQWPKGLWKSHNHLPLERVVLN
ncbi:hypothetical protein N9329_03865 [Gammaproteobacteria bacterium]|nr:hypothetical protein [Gammaproteobacteria bacterium]